MAAKKTGLIALVAILVVAAAGAGGWWWMNRDGGGASGDANSSADQPLTAEIPAGPNATPTPANFTPGPSAEQFDLVAVIDDPNGFTNVHSGPSTVSPIVARVSNGETFSTFEQGDDWWRVRTAGGLIGFMPRRRISLQGDAPSVPGAPPPVATATVEPNAVPGQVMPAAPAPAAERPKATAQRPRPPRLRSRVNRANSANMRAFCQNAGRGTPQCRQFARELRGR